ncbi:lytic transglycosylase domain-containing protein [Porticoccaceae bacterium]|nr:lytic transglycosylase domain-containing protein [Porticoccaceae bacterium]MDA8663470.1 lytic transglycosylase domain-containing protein [Porticoccaceae bacterium]MDA8788826.1 lytic transglycosylase domain-containing protein [Porticoccaceae bacterium]MDB2343174.1 lytic transglycosylase domain-containing protein [Porticoccaceae bacterium]MDB2664982.1 lytic transglycosylase domain-containing protein [Porticoccaceae bacterium]
MELPAYIDYIEPLTVECVELVTQSTGIHPDILFAIAIVEGGEVGRSSKPNKDGSQDIGLMQINSIHLPHLESFGITPQLLRDDGCVNFKVAAWHVASVTKNKGGLTDPDIYLESIAAYHSFTDEFNAAYAEKLRSAFQFLYKNQE